MKSILICPKTRSIEFIETEAKLKDLQEIIETSCIACFHYKEHLFYYDDLFLEKENEETCYWTIPSDFVTCIAGRSLVFLGKTDKEGNELPPKQDFIHFLRKHIVWM